MAIRRLVTALGVAQIVSWGTLFYAIGVLGGPMRRELGISELFLFGSFTAGLLVSGAVAPWAGRTIDRLGGRVVLSAGSLLAATAMALLAFAPNAGVMVVGWLVAGAAMAACLYDPAFATLSQHTGERYRRAVTTLTLFGGFASTAFWPLSHLLLEAWGWRVTWGLYALLHLALCLPIHLTVIPGRPARVPAAASATEAPAARPALTSDRRLLWFAACFAAGTFIFGVIAVHLINLLTSAGLTSAQAVTISMLVGPLQVAGRVIELATARHVRAVVVGYTVFGFMAIAIACLMGVAGMGVAAVAFVVAYGIGNGLFTVVKGTVPAEIFGREALGARIGFLSGAAFFAKALAPAAYAGFMAAGLTRNQALAGLLGVAAVGAACFAIAARSMPPPLAQNGSSPSTARLR